jgi:hypothetical protein
MLTHALAEPRRHRGHSSKASCLAVTMVFTGIVGVEAAREVRMRDDRTASSKQHFKSDMAYLDVLCACVCMGQASTPSPVERR